MMEPVVQVANVVGGFATLIVAWLVYQFGKQQAARSNQLAERQHDLDRQSFRLNLLERRLEVVADVREVWTDYMMHARPQPEMIQKLITALQKARLIYNDDFISDLDTVADHLLSLQRNYARQREAEEYYQDDKMRGELLEKQFAIEDKLMPVLEPLFKKIQEATRVREPSAPSPVPSDDATRYSCCSRRQNLS